MLENTKKYWQLIKRDFKCWDLVLTLLYAIALFIFPLFAIVVNLGNMYVNFVLIAIALIYGAVLSVLILLNKYQVKALNISLNVILALITLGVNMYSIYLVFVNKNEVGVILVSLMCILWVLKVAFSLTSNIFLSRAQLLTLNLKEDIKPVINEINDLSIKVNENPVIDLSIEDSDDEKTKKERFNKMLTEVDTNKDGNVDILELIALGIRQDSTYIGRDKFLATYLSSINTKQKVIDKYILHGPRAAGFKAAEVNTLVKNFIDSNKEEVELIINLFNGDVFDLNNEEEFNSLLEAFSRLMTTMQKIIYLYGFSQIEDRKHLNDVQITALTLAFHIMLDDQFSYTSMMKLFDAINPDIKRKVQQFAKDKVKFLKDHDDQIYDFVKDCGPIVSDWASKYNKIYVELVADLAVALANKQ